MTTQTPLTDEDLLAFAHGDMPPDAALAARIAADPAAQATLAAWAAQDAALGALYQPVAAEPVPARLTDILRRAEAAPPTRGLGWLWQTAAALAVLAVGAGAGWVARDATQAAPQLASLQMDAVRAHDTFVAEVRHPVEVPASDSEHLNTWMSKRMGRDMQPPDFAASGFTLLGGRIVPSAQGPAAFYMYEDAQGQRVTLYLLPRGNGDSTAFQFAQDGATQTVFWMDEGLSCAVVGDIPRDVLNTIATAAYDQLI